MNTYTIPAVDSAVGNSNPAYARPDALYTSVPPCGFVRPAYLSSRFDTYNPDGSGAMAAWAFAAIAFKKVDLSFLDNKKISAMRLWLNVLAAAPALHGIAAYCPAGAAFAAGATIGACAYSSAAGRDVLPHQNPGSTLVGWRCFTVPSLAVLKGIVQRGVRVDDTGLSTSPALATQFTAYPHSHATYAPYLEVQYEDEYTPPTCEALEPAATVVDSDGAVAFRWSYAQAANAPQTHVSLQVRNVGGSWQNVVTKYATAAQTYTAPGGISLRGECQWRVQVFCTAGGVASEWSDVKSFLSTGSPAAPRITDVTPTPRCTVTWQQEGQTGFELHLLGPDGAEVWASGQRLSADRALTFPMLLADGGHTLRLRTLNAQGRWGPYAAAAVLVKNAPSGNIAASCEAAGGGLRVRWTADREFEGYVVLKVGAGAAGAGAANAAGAGTTGNAGTGVTFTQTSSLDPATTEYTDRQALGFTRYIVRGLLGRHYTDSPVVSATYSVAHAEIGGAEGGDFIPLEMRVDAPPRHRHSRSASVRYVQYEGAALPARYHGGGQRRGHSLYFTLACRAHYDALLALVGQAVIYRDREGDVFCGVLDSVVADSGAGAGAGFDAALTLTETQEVAGLG